LGHLFIDQFRTFVFTDNTKGKGLLLLILDQIAHIILIAFLAWAATGWTFADLQVLFTEAAPNQFRAIVYLGGLAILIGVIPILEIEITVAVWAAQGTQVNHTVGIDKSDRIFGSLERAIGLALILIGWWWVSPLVFIPRLALMIYQGQANANRTAVASKMATSFISTILVSWMLWFVPFPIFS